MLTKWSSKSIVVSIIKICNGIKCRIQLMSIYRQNTLYLVRLFGYDIPYGTHLVSIMLISSQCREA